MTIEQLLREVEATKESANVRTVFGDPVTVGDRTIIPVARVRGAQGIGFGEGAEKEGASGRGGGSGAVFSAQPVAVVEITPDGTRIVPIVDATRVAALGLLVSAWAVFWCFATLRAIRKQSVA